VPNNNQAFCRAFSPEPEEGSDFANPVDEFMAITNRRLCEVVPQFEFQTEALPFASLT
jgi:hypothetical protein